jgi:hypothetical protein
MLMDLFKAVLATAGIAKKMEAHTLRYPILQRYYSIDDC